MGNAPKRRHSPAQRRTAAPSPSGGNRWFRPALWIAGLGVLGLLVWFVASDVTSNPQVEADPPPGTQYFTVGGVSHTTGAVVYEQDPPVGGPHDPQWLSCQAYDEPVRNENAVHSLEHGAVWITYRPDLDDDTVGSLRRFARRSEVIVSPYPGLDVPVVVSSWGTQLRLDTVDTDLIDQFYRAFQNRTAPEGAAGC